ncbi:MAG: hypothetical protein WA423_00190, partial [Candidatus Sulfotelmatobacter sp.]
MAEPFLFIFISFNWGDPNMAGRNAPLCNKSGKSPQARYLPFLLAVFTLAVFALAAQSTAFAQAKP